MNMPIDPTQLSGEDIGEQRVTLEMDHDAAIDVVRTTCMAEGFGVPVEFSPSELLNEKVGADRDPYYVLGACNPSMANRALAETQDIGALFPCNIIIRELEPGVQEVYHVSIMRIARLLGIAPDSEEWADIIGETGALVDATFSALAEQSD